MKKIGIFADGALHCVVKQRWEMDAYGPQGNSKAMKQLLESVEDDGSAIEIAD